MRDPEAQLLITEEAPDLNVNTLEVEGSGICSLIPLQESQGRRNLGRYSTLILFIGRMVGSGIFATPGVIFEQMNSSPILFAIVWSFGGLVGYSGLSVYLELGSYLPVSGATKVFLEFIFPSPEYYWTVVFGTFTILFTYCSTNAVVFGQYLRYSMGYSDDENSLKHIAVLLILAGLISHSVSKKMGIRFQNTIGAFKLVILGILLFSSIWILIVPSAITGVDKSGLTEYSFIQDLTSLSQNIRSIPLSVFASATLKSIYSFGGWTTAHTVQNEIKDPINTIRKTASLSFMFTFLLYAAVNLTYIVVIPHDKIKGKLIGVVLFARVFGPTLGRQILSFIISLSAAGNVLVVIFADSRLYQEIAREGFAPFSRILATNIRDIPVFAIFLHCFMSIAIILLPISKDIYSFIVSMTIYPNQLFHAILSYGVFKLRMKFPTVVAPLKAPMFLVCTCLIGSSTIVISPLIDIYLGDYHNSTYTFGSIITLVAASAYWLTITKLIPKILKTKLIRVTEDLNSVRIKTIKYRRIE